MILQAQVQELVHRLPFRGSGIASNDYLEVVGYQGIYSGNALVEDRFVVGTNSTGSGGAYNGSAGNHTTVFPVANNTGDLVCVYRNGIKLVHTTDFTVQPTASTVTLASPGANTADEITVHVIGILQHSNFVPTSGGTFTGTVAHTGTLDVSGGTLTTSTAQKTAIVDGGKGNLAKSDVGLGNVDNESKATMFTSPTFTGTPTVSSSSASYSPTLDINNSNTGAYGGILKFTAKSGSTTYTPAQIRAYGGSGSSDGVLAIETAGSERLRIDSSGNVGIGGAGQTSTGGLTITATGSNGARCYLGATGTGSADIVLDGSNGDFAGSDYYMLRQLNSLDVEHWLGTSGDYIFRTNAGTERMRITNAGYTTFPVASKPSWFITNSTSDNAFSANSVATWNVRNTAGRFVQGGVLIVVDKLRFLLVGYTILPV